MHLIVPGSEVGHREILSALGVVLPAEEPDSGEGREPQINIVLNRFEELTDRVPAP